MIGGYLADWEGRKAGGSAITHRSNRPGGQTSIEVTHYRVKSFGGDLEVFDTFTLTLPRDDGRR